MDPHLTAMLWCFLRAAVLRAAMAGCSSGRSRCQPAGGVAPALPPARVPTSDRCDASGVTGVDVTPYLTAGLPAATADAQQSRCAL
jgi:hypothetical protein